MKDFLSEQEDLAKSMSPDIVSFNESLVYYSMNLLKIYRNI